MTVFALFVKTQGLGGGKFIEGGCLFEHGSLAKFVLEGKAYLSMDAWQSLFLRGKFI